MTSQLLTKKEIQKFWNNVEKEGPIYLHFPELSPCWEWRGTTYKSGGYGRFAPRQFTDFRAHRVSWELYNGPIPDGLQVLHHCDNPPCVRPSHLFLGTVRDNSIDAYSKGRNIFLYKPDVAPKGDRHHGAKLNYEKVLDIRQRIKSRQSLTKIAKFYKVSISTVSLIKLGKIWKDQ